MEDVQLYGFHAIQVALDHLDGLKVASCIDHQTAPGKAWLVIDRDCGHAETLGRNRYQLEECLQAVHCAEGIGRRDHRAGGRNFEAIGLIFTKAQDSIARAGRLYDQRRSGARYVVVIGNARFTRERADKSFARGLQTGILMAFESDSETAVDLEVPVAARDMGRDRHDWKRRTCLAF